jgi:hypothetical protein
MREKNQSLSDRTRIRNPAIQYRQVSSKRDRDKQKFLVSVFEHASDDDSWELEGGGRGLVLPSA